MDIRKAIFVLVIFCGLSAAGFASAAALQVSISNAYPIQGDTILVGVAGSASMPQTAVLGTETANFFPFGGKSVAAIGFKVTAPTGWQQISVHFADGATVTRWIDVLKKKITVENFAIPPSLGVTPTQLVQSLTDENATLNAILGTVTPQTYITRGFGLPLANNRYVTDVYGVLRKTGDQEIWHLGTDFAAASGSTVAAMNSGVVRFASSTFSYGNTVIVDHGEGIYSMYLHMSKILAAVGQAVKQGQVLGLVGDTGFSTGEHLHISIKVNGVSVDPLRFVGIFK